ncbi:MAG: trimeric intracellular cation channel family protein [Chitinophagaceae bacterium]|nr:trimeric intracellular cation channel family protein [Chitinophagaceae bacterium]
MNILQLIAYTGIFIFAVTGALKARTHKMDIFGAVVLAFATAYGGGTVRDLLIGIRPVNWVNDYLALGLVLGAVVIVFLLNNNVTKFRKTIFFTDAIGIGMFTAAGIEISLGAGLNDGYAVIMGVISATFGGLIADILSNEVPNLLRRGELYATACLAGGLVYILLEKAGLQKNINLLICIMIVVALRILSKRKKVQLPEI